MRVHPRHRIDLSAADLAIAACACAVPARRRTLAAGVEEAWSPSGGALACLSVRSGLDLLLSALDLPPGSEVLVSAITIPDMVRILQGHGLVPVPVDVEASTLAPRIDLAEQLVTDSTRAVLVAHLFGGHVDLAPLAALARRHHLLVIEDCAQAFAGPGDTGSDLADVSLFSFGPIKTATALGGALVRVRDAHLLDRMRRIHATWPVQRRSAYARRVIRFSALALLQHPLPYGVVSMLAQRAGRPLDDVVGGIARTFPGAVRLRRQPSAALLRLLGHRLRHFDLHRLAERADRGEAVASALGPEVIVPGIGQLRRTHWLFAVAVDRPGDLVAGMRAGGLDASTATSALVAVPAPPGRSMADPALARRLLARIVFLPVYPELPAPALHRLVRLAADQGHQGGTLSPTTPRFPAASSG